MISVANVSTIHHILSMVLWESLLQLEAVILVLSGISQRFHEKFKEFKKKL